MTLIHVHIHDDNTVDTTAVGLGHDGVYFNIAHADRLSAAQDLVESILSQYRSLSGEQRDSDVPAASGVQE